MKVAILSNQPGQVGKSVLSILFSTLFSITQGKTAVLFSTEDMQGLYNMVNVSAVASQIKSMSVYKALLETNALMGNEIIDYSDRIGSTDVFAFNIFSAAMERSDLESIFIDTLNKCDVELSLVEIKGDVNSPFNKRILYMCDAIMYVFNPNRSSIEAMKEYKEKIDKRLLLKTGFVCQQYDANVLSEKRLAKDADINLRNLTVVPRCASIAKFAYDGNLEQLAEAIKVGLPEVTILRPKLLEIMQSIFDDGRIKYIKGVEHWLK